MMKQTKMCEQDWEEIQPYVCYEKTLYHFLKRTHNIEIFTVLYMDRYKGFTYHDGPEPILPYKDGISRIRSKIEKVYKIKLSKLKDFLKLTFIGDVKGQTALLTTFPDGNIAYTSVFIEKVEEEIIYISRSNAVMNDLYLPLSLEEFINLVGKEENIVTISTFEKNLDSVFNINYSEYFKNPINYVMGNLLGYSCKSNKLWLNNEEIFPNTVGLEKFTESFVENKERFVKGGIPKVWQLRMNKNISNKLVPVLNAWERIIIDDSDNDYHRLQDSINVLKKNIDDLYKWFSVCYAKVNIHFLNSYEESLKELVRNFKNFQRQAHSEIITNLETSK